jgi:hypothetical protein
VADAYPAVSYPQGDYGSQGDDGSGFGSGVNIGGLFSGLLGAAGTIGSGLTSSGFGLGVWGWVLNWFTHSLFLNGSFFDGLGFHNYGGGGYRGGGGYGGAVWAHNPAHRLGVPYSNGFVSARYRGGDFGGRAGSWRSGFAGSGRSSFDGWHRPGFESRGSNSSGFRSAGAGAYRSGFASNGGGSHGWVMGERMGSNFRGSAAFDRAPQRAFAAPRESLHFSSQHFSAPRSSPQHFSAPHFSAPKGSSHFSGHGGGGHSGGGHSGGGHSGGGHSGKGSHKH